jgi:LCP family protein required for cell wall assembly
MSLLKLMSTTSRTFRTYWRRAIAWLGWSILVPGLLGCGGLQTAELPTATQTVPTPSPTETPTPTPTVTATVPSAVCGGPPAMFILLVGSDARSNGYGSGLADSIRIVRVDFITPRVQLLTFHRDLYVEIPGLASHNITAGKLNQAYLYGNPAYRYYDGEGQGPGLLALTLEHNFGTQVDHFAAVNLQSFVRIVDALGGIDIDLPRVIDGRAKNSKDTNRYFAAGPQHLNGYRTMLLARLRPQGDIKRTEVQDLILRAIAEKTLDPTVLQKLPKLVEAFSGSVQTDLGAVEIGQLLCLAAMLDTQKIEFVNFPENLFESGRVRDPVLGNTSILKADFDVLKTYVVSFINGTWPKPGENP